MTTATTPYRAITLHRHVARVVRVRELLARVKAEYLSAFGHDANITTGDRIDPRLRPRREVQR